MSTRISAYQEFVSLTTLPNGHGFPRAQVIHEWVPGFSTPEGAYLLAAQLSPYIPGGDLSDPVAQMVANAASVVAVAAATGIPAAAVWLGAALVR